MSEYIVITNYQEPGKKRIITHAYTSHSGMTKKEADKLKMQIVREHRKWYPGKATFLRVSICKVFNQDLVNRNIARVQTDAANPAHPGGSRKEYRAAGVPMEYAHRGPSGEVLI